VIYKSNDREIAKRESGLKKINLPIAGVYFIKSGGEIKKIYLSIFLIGGDKKRQNELGNSNNTNDSESNE
jgi:hypothetical protein